MIKRLFIILLLLLMCGCEAQIEDEKELTGYLDPISEIDLFNALKTETKKRIYEDNDNTALSSNQLKMIGRSAPDFPLIDIDGNEIDINKLDNVVFEIVATWCTHCQTETKEYLTEIVTMFPDMTFIQYFNEGTPDEIYQFYTNLNIPIPENVIVIPQDDRVHEYFNQNYLLEYYPTFIAFKKGTITCMIDQEVTFNRFCGFYDLAFNSPLKSEELVNEDGVSIFELNRDMDDLYNDLSLENQKKLDDLSENKYTKELTLTKMSKSLDYYNTLDAYSGNYLREVNDYSFYIDKDVVLVYLYFESAEEALPMISLMNDCIEANPDLNYIGVLIEGEFSSSMIYNYLSEKLHAPVVSILSDIPSDFYSFTVHDFPSAVFVEKSTFTGAYTDIKNVETFNKALDMFIGDNCIALRKNNQ